MSTSTRLKTSPAGALAGKASSALYQCIRKHAMRWRSTWVSNPQRVFLRCPVPPPGFFAVGLWVTAEPSGFLLAVKRGFCVFSVQASRA